MPSSSTPVVPAGVHIIATIAVIGAGILGRGIAHAAALAGYPTILEDILPASLRQAEADIRTDLHHSVESGELVHAAAHAALSRIGYAGSVEAAARAADLVIEAVPDDLESKIEIFTLLDKICRPHTILACNTSGLGVSVSDVASVTYRASKILGTRFVHPVRQMKLLEITRARETDDATLASACEVGRRMGKQVVVAAEFPEIIAGAPISRSAP
jgi:3-hydroxybutyryl-CoA dehydrogenase